MKAELFKLPIFRFWKASSLHIETNGLVVGVDVIKLM
jgi:hypothetical protein